MITQLSLMETKDKIVFISPLILSARVGHNADQFLDILQIYVPEGSLIADVTWGEGRFWQNVDLSHYRVIGTDIAGGPHGVASFYTLPFAPNSLDALVFDPPYTYNGSISVKASIAKCYNLDSSPIGGMAGILKMYQLGIREAHRVLKPHGVLIIKCQDQIESSKQCWIHKDLMDSPGFFCIDLFVLVQKGTPARRWPQQQHARKNHSFWVVLRKLVMEANDE